jgi:hypothetical protein
MKKFLVWILGSLFLLSSAINAEWVQGKGAGNGYIVTAIASGGGNVFAGIFGHGVYISSDSGASWTAVNSGLTNLTVISLAVIGKYVFAGTNGGAGIFLSSNSGSNWIASDSGLPLNSDVPSLAVTGYGVYAGVYGGGIFSSGDLGKTWTAVNSGLTNKYIQVLCASGNNLYAGTGTPAMSCGGVFSFNYIDANWTAVNTGFGLTSGCIVYSVIRSGNNIFAGTASSGIFITNGTGWVTVNSGLTSTAVLSLTAIDGNVFAGCAGSGGGVFLSANNGTSWTSVDSGLTSTLVLSLAIMGKYVFAGTDGGGIWRRPLVEILTVAVQPRAEKSGLNAGGLRIIAAKKNIAVFLPNGSADGAVTVELFNAAGKIIYSAAQKINNGRLNIPVAELSAGVYLIMVAGNNIKLSSPLIVAK